MSSTTALNVAARLHNFSIPCHLKGVMRFAQMYHIVDIHEREGVGGYGGFAGASNVDIHHSEVHLDRKNV